MELSVYGKTENKQDQHMKHITHSMLISAVEEKQNRD